MNKETKTIEQPEQHLIAEAENMYYALKATLEDLISGEMAENPDTREAALENIQAIINRIQNK